MAGLRRQRGAGVVVEAGREEHFDEVLGRSGRPSVPSIGRLQTTTPPYAETGSAACARAYASSIVVPSATPHGFVCFTITHAGTVNSSESARAADRSARLLNDSASPCSCSTRERTWRRAPASA